MHSLPAGGRRKPAQIGTPCPESVPPPERAASRVSFTSRKLRLSAPPKRKIPQRADGAKKRRRGRPGCGGKLSSAAAQAMPPTGQRNVTNQKDRSVAARRAGDRVGDLVRLLDAVLPVKGIRHIQRTVRQLSGFRHSADRFRSGRLGDSRTGGRRRPAAGNHDAAGLRIDAAGRIFRLLRMPGGATRRFSVPRLLSARSRRPEYPGWPRTLRSRCLRSQT